MADFTGIFNTNEFPTDLAKKSFAGMITRLMPNGAAPLFAITSMLESENAVQIEHGFFTKTMLFPQLTISGAQIAADTTITVTDTSNVLPGMIMRVQATGENLIIDSVVDSTHVKVTRGLGSVAAGALADAGLLYQIGNAFEESSTRPNALNIKPVRITNLTHIFRNTWAVSETVRNTMMIAGDTNVAESKQDCAAFHASDIERAVFFSQKSQGSRNGQPFRTMDGFLSIVSNLAYYPSSIASANVNTAGATTTWDQLEGFVDPVWDQTTDPRGSNERIMFVGGTAHKVINNIGRKNATYMVTGQETAFGLRFSTFNFTRGTVRLIEHPQFNSNSDWSKLAMIVDLATFRLAYLGDRKTQHKAFNNDANEANDDGIDAQGGTLTTEVTTVIKNPPANAVIWNLTAAA